MMAKRGPRWQPLRAERDWYAARLIAGALATGWTYEAALKLAAAEFGAWPERKRHLSPAVFRLAYDRMAGRPILNAAYCLVPEELGMVRHVAERHGMRKPRKYGRKVK
jgi:hypothetical protein